MRPFERGSYNAWTAIKRSEIAPESLLSSKCMDYLIEDARTLYDDPVSISAYGAGVLVCAARATIKKRREKQIAG